MTIGIERRKFDDRTKEREGWKDRLAFEMINRGGMETSEGNNNVPMRRYNRGGGSDERRKRGIRSVAGEQWAQVGGGRSTPGFVGNQVTARSLSHPPSSVPPRRQIKPSVRTIVAELIRNMYRTRPILFDSKRSVHSRNFSYFIRLVQFRNLRGKGSISNSSNCYSPNKPGLFSTVKFNTRKNNKNTRGEEVYRDSRYFVRSFTTNFNLIFTTGGRVYAKKRHFHAIT